VDPRDALTLSVAIVAFVRALLSFGYSIRHGRSAHSYVSALCGVTSFAVFTAEALRLVGVLQHGNAWFPIAVLAMMVSAIAYVILEW
jgi:hypothetical protein